MSVLVSTGFGVGFLPRFPGTWGSLATVLLFHVLHAWAGLSGVAIFTGVAATLGGAAAHRTAKRLGISDPSEIVIDEVAGQSIALLFVYGLFPVHESRSWFLGMVLLGFALFRLFDIWKPGPIGWLERLPGGVGIMIDDLLAGLFSGLAIGAVRLIVFRI